jgi:hypothetical protein
MEKKILKARDMLVKIQNDPISMGLWKYVTKLHMFLPFGQKNLSKKRK